MPIATPKQFAAMLDAAQEGGYAYPAINCSSITTLNGVFNGYLNSKHTANSNAKRTTNCPAPVVKVLEGESGIMTTMHTQTGGQRPLKHPNRRPAPFQGALALEKS